MIEDVSVHGVLERLQNEILGIYASWPGTIRLWLVSYDTIPAKHLLSLFKRLVHL